MQIDFFSVGCNQPYRITKPIRLIELFAGIGSQSKALERLQANFEHYRICEFDKYAVQSYNAIHGTNFKPSDITKIKAADLGITETDKYEYIMTYSFPCTDLSVAGKQSGMAKGSGTRSGLLWEVERLLTECKELPQVLLMENVPQVLNGDFGGWLTFLEELGYRNYYKCLNAKNYGIPQNRDRCFMVSVLGDYYYDFPKPIPLELRLKDMLEIKVDEKYYLSDKSIKNLKLNKEVSNAVRSGGRGSTDRHSWDLVQEPTIIQHPLGYNKGAELEHYPSITTSSWESNNFIKEPQLQQVAQLEGMVVEPSYRIRKLTPLECYRLMGFDDSDFYKAKAAGVSDSQLYKQAGNSIVVKVLEEIFKKLF